MELASDSVILVFNPHVLAKSRHCLGGVGNGRGEHRAKRHEPARRSLVETTGTREQRRLAEIAGEHHGTIDCDRRSAERSGDRLLHQSLAQPDAQLRGDQLGDVARLVGARKFKERGKQRRPLTRNTRPGDPPKCEAELVDRDPRRLPALDT